MSLEAERSTAIQEVWTTFWRTLPESAGVFQIDELVKKTRQQLIELGVTPSELPHACGIGDIDSGSLAREPGYANLLELLGLTKNGEVGLSVNKMMLELLSSEFAEGRNPLGYDTSFGLPQLRHQMAARLRDSGLPTLPEHLAITPGGSNALHAAILALAMMATESKIRCHLILPNTSFSQVVGVVIPTVQRAYSALVPHVVGTSRLCRHTPTPEQLLNIVSTPGDTGGDLVALYLTLHSPPASQDYDFNLLTSTLEQLSRHPGRSVVIADLAYLGMGDQDAQAKFLALMRAVQNQQDMRLVVVGTFSKIMAQPGVRVGYMSSTWSELMQRIPSIQIGLANVGTSAKSQIYTLARMQKVSPETWQKIPEILRLRQQQVVSIIKSKASELIEGEPASDNPLYVWVELKLGVSWLQFSQATNLIGLKITLADGRVGVRLSVGTSTFPQV